MAKNSGSESTGPTVDTQEFTPLTTNVNERISQPAQDQDVASQINKLTNAIQTLKPKEPKMGFQAWFWHGMKSANAFAVLLQVTLGILLLCITPYCTRIKNIMSNLIEVADQHASNKKS